MANLSLFPMDPLLIRAPKIFKDPEEFILYVNPEYQSSDRFKGALSNFRDHKRDKKFVIGLVWDDKTWSVVYDTKLSWVELLPGIINAAYHAARQGQNSFPIERSPRESFSDDRNARV